MKITNKSNEKIIYQIDDEMFFLEPQQFVEITNDNFKKICFKKLAESFSVLESEGSKILKLLSIISDPFKLMKGYHLVVNCTFEKEKFCNFQEIEIFTQCLYADFEVRTYYDYILVKGGGQIICPSMVNVSNQKPIIDEFSKNNRKLNIWLSVCDIFIEPFLFEAVGYFALYLIFSIWLGWKAIYVVLAFLVLSILIEVIIALFKLKKTARQRERFISLFLSQSIMEKCYIKLL